MTGRCPRCRAPLFVEQVQDAELDGCASCQGLWLDRATLDRLLTERRGTTTDAVLARLAGEPPRPPRLDEADERPCPVCVAPMRTIALTGRSALVLDVCAEHGTWFDADELPRLLVHARGDDGDGGRGARDARPSRDGAATPRRRDRSWSSSETLLDLIVEGIGELLWR